MVPLRVLTPPSGELYPRAAEVALEHALSLKPSSSGPSHAELTLLRLGQLVEGGDGVDEAELAAMAKRSHAEAMRHNPSLAMHTLKSAFGEVAVEGSFADVLAIAMERRQKKLSSLANAGPLLEGRTAKAAAWRHRHQELRGETSSSGRAEASWAGD